MEKFKGFQTLLLAGMFVVAACRSAKTSQAYVANNKQEVNESGNKCHQQIRYYIDKLKVVNGGEEVNASTTIVIHPAAKRITVTSDPPNQEKVSFDTEIESMDCSLNADLTEGQATYRGYIKQPDGARTYSVLKIEAREGRLTISGGHSESGGGLVLPVKNWEVVAE